MTDSRDEPEDAPPPRVSGKKKRGRNDGTVIDNGSRIRGKVVRCRRGRVVLMYRTEGDRERRTEKDDRRKEVGLAPVCAGCCLVTPTVIKDEGRRRKKRGAQ